MVFSWKTTIFHNLRCWKIFSNYPADTHGFFCGKWVYLQYDDRWSVPFRVIFHWTMIKGERVSWGQNKDRRKKNDQATQLGFWLFLESLQMEGWWNGMVIHEDRITYVKEDTQACRCFTQQVFPANNRTVPQKRKRHDGSSVIYEASNGRTYKTLAVGLFGEAECQVQPKMIDCWPSKWIIGSLHIPLYTFVYG